MYIDRIRTCKIILLAYPLHQWWGRGFIYNTMTFPNYLSRGGLSGGTYTATGFRSPLHPVFQSILPLAFHSFFPAIHPNTHIYYTKPGIAVPPLTFAINDRKLLRKE